MYAETHVGVGGRGGDKLEGMFLVFHTPGRYAEQWKYSGTINVRAPLCSTVEGGDGDAQCLVN